MPSKTENDPWCIENDFAAQQELAERELARKCTYCLESERTQKDQAQFIKELQDSAAVKDNALWGFIDIIERKFNNCKGEGEYTDGVYDAYDCIVDTNEFKMAKQALNTTK